MHLFESSQAQMCFGHRKRDGAAGQNVDHCVGKGLESDLLFRVFLGGLGGWSPCRQLL